MICRGTGIKVSPHFQPAIMCNQKHKVWIQSGHQSCFLPKKTLYHNTLLWPLLQGLTICLKLTSKKTSQQLISTNGQTLVRFSPVSRWPLLKHEVPRPTFHSVPVPTCRPVAGRSGRSCLYMFKKCDVFLVSFWDTLGMPWVASAFFCWLENLFL